MNENTKEMKIPCMKSIDELAEMGVLTAGKLRNMVRNNQVPHIKIGKRGKILINFDKLLEMMNNGMTV